MLSYRISVTFVFHQTNRSHKSHQQKKLQTIQPKKCKSQPTPKEIITQTQPIRTNHPSPATSPSLQTSLSRSPCTLEVTTRSEPAKSTKDNKP